MLGYPRENLSLATIASVCAKPMGGIPRRHLSLLVSVEDPTVFQWEI